ncbi:Fe(3+)-hydroxamate ABC transporter permease FhuB [Paraburkholderia phosphatilytica]|uniref:Fe(3+)-hydroxamate ABC transporter permease FhuB n=1 Tax=Paraburkholderia phosphatilytica TaxID=2282883 RepID=UPI000E4A150F|nr:Fe(3+)-hydroxamate ABC transporter permease FhuB [Paraburkholderia phosphatilytica]
MKTATQPEATPRVWRLPVWLAVVALLLAAHGLSNRLPVAQWSGVFDAGSSATLPQLVVQYAWLPRLVVSLLAGAALSLAGVVFQLVLRNPLAEPLTLGVSAGAYLAMTLATVFAPIWLAEMRFAVALAGAVVAMLATAALTWRKGFAPVSVVIAGMVVNLYCGAIAVLLTIVFERSLVSVFIWGGGSLSQNGWDAAIWLLPRVAACGLGAALLVRPLTLFSLDDHSASQLGLTLARTRVAALGIAVLLSAFVVSAVGVIGFVGLAGPALARLVGARRPRDQLLWAPALGAALLMLVDQAVQSLPGIGETLPTGAAIALFGGPLLLWMLGRFRVDDARPVADAAEPLRRSLLTIALAVGTLLLIASLVSLRWNLTLSGWHWTTAVEWPQIAFWRVPRFAASLSAGGMLALSGTLLQRVTGNPMASPELLGVSGGAMLGTLAAALFAAGPSAATLFAGSSAGALLFLGAIVAIGRRHRYAPNHLLIAGIALSAFSQAVILAATASGSAYATWILPLLYGSTQLISLAMAVSVTLSAFGMAAVALLCGRWLDILPLGANVADALGVDSARARLVLLVIAAALTAGATIVVGPMSFVGLMAPQLARLLGFPRARAQMLVASMIGALLMVFADWLGRNLIFPQQLPAGVLATLIGGPYLMWLLRRD